MSKSQWQCLKVTKKLIFLPGTVGAGGFVPPGVPSPVSRFFPTTAPGLKFGDNEFGPRRKNYLHFPLNGAGIRRGIKPTGGRIKRELVGGMERMHKFHNGHLSLGRVRDWAVGGGPPRVYRHQNNHSISPPWANNIQTHPSQTHQNSKKKMGRRFFDQR